MPGTRGTRASDGLAGMCFHGLAGRVVCLAFPIMFWIMHVGPNLP
jgi:hypothetical protein